MSSLVPCRLTTRNRPLLDLQGPMEIDRRQVDVALPHRVARTFRPAAEDHPRTIARLAHKKKRSVPAECKKRVRVLHRLTPPDHRRDDQTDARVGTRSRQLWIPTG